MTGRGPDRYGAEAAIKASDLPAPSRLLLHTLLTHVTNGTLTVPAEYAPSITTLVAETGLGRGTVADHLNTLEGEKWLKRSRPTTRQALKKHARTGYQITVPVRLLNPSGSRTSPGAGRGQEESQVKARPGAGLVQEPDGSRPGAGRNSNVSPTSSSPTEKKGGAGGSAPHASKGEHPRFAEWYAVYPAHKARAAAVTAYAKAVKKADPDDLVAAAKRYRDSRNVRRGFAMNPATWLNGECWLDDVDEPLAADGYRPYRNPTDQSVYDEAI